MDPFSSKLATFLRESSEDFQEERKIVSTLSNAGNSVTYRSVGRSITFGPRSEIIVSDGEFHITAESQEAVKLRQKLHENLQTLESIYKSQLKQLEENHSKQIQQMYLDLDESLRKEQDEHEHYRTILRNASSKKITQLEREDRDQTFDLYMQHEQRIAQLEQRKKEESEKYERSRIQAEVKFREYTHQMEVTLDLGMQGLQRRVNTAVQDSKNAANNYNSTVAMLQAKLSEARNSFDRL